MSSRNKSIRKFASSQFEPKLEAEAAEYEENELSELDSLYQASLRAGRRLSPAAGKTGMYRLRFVYKLALVAHF